MKKCTLCSETKPDSSFYPRINHNRTKTQYLLSRCKECSNRWYREKTAKFPRWQGERIRKARYGVTPEQYAAMLVRQEYCCGLCKRPFYNEKPHLDHNHATGKARAILHRKCNLLLGFAEEDIETLNLAVDYLDLHRDNNG